MQTPYLKFLHTPKGSDAVFYQEKDRIFCRILHGQAAAPLLLAEHTLPRFSLCRYRDYTYLLYTTQQGEVTLSASPDLYRWEPRVLFRQESRQPISYFMVPQQDALHLIYHQPIGNTGIHGLMYTVYRQGQCQKPYCIDHFLPSPSIIFQAKRLSENHLILYYRSAKTTLSARELLLSPFTVGSLSPLAQTSSPWLDLSIHDHGEKIHLLYLVRNLFRTQVLYRYRQTSAMSRPRLIWEGVGCTSCLLTQQKEVLSLLWTAGGETFRCISTDNGHTFGPVESLTEDLPPALEKGRLVSDPSESFAEETLGNPEWFYLPDGISSQSEQQSISAAEAHREELSRLLSQKETQMQQAEQNWRQQMAQLEARLSSLRLENERLRQKEAPSASEAPSEE
ncbi:hypothetical protein H9X85_11290 [Anaerotignum lactatifermentans]|uniref:Sialidase domain-containing protein n=1 Tax=Anaerotignum lactatifermentans TaxID=160404 RepID=A0ABS2GC09_9FIRM|nr:hypothetical protein [Anaerotignum lactatifermentans]MBM6830165.1 hypothetical protein [Anaerotignum lactatifermentans]MBM6878690.1 hypothetical protein [Anaerotignum lactatifermentans]MBM6951778.1 hypothetical protein [Anaerotignum lactatifermentans]